MLKTLFVKTVSECKKLRSLTQKVIYSNATNIYQKGYDNVSKEYGDNIHESIIPKDDYATLDEVWIVYTNHKVPYPDFLIRKKTKRGVSYYDKKIIPGKTERKV